MSNNGNTKDSEEAEERRYRAFELKKAGYTLRDIGRLCGGISHTQASRDIKRVLKELRPPQEDVDKMRDMEVLRLESYLLRLKPKIEAGEYGAIDRAIRISDQIAELRGLKASRAVDVNSGEVELRIRIVDPETARNTNQ